MSMMTNPHAWSQLEFLEYLEMLAGPPPSPCGYYCLVARCLQSQMMEAETAKSLEACRDPELAESFVSSSVG